MWRNARVALLDPNIKTLPGARAALGASFAASAADAVLTAGQAWGLACALAGLWEGGALGAQLPWVALFAACFAQRQLLALGRGAFLDRFSRRAASDLRRQLAEALYDGGPAAVQRTGTGSASFVPRCVTYRADVMAHPAKTAGINMLFSFFG